MPISAEDFEEMVLLSKTVKELEICEDKKMHKSIKADIRKSVKKLLKPKTKKEDTVIKIILSQFKKENGIVKKIIESEEAQKGK